MFRTNNIEIVRNCQCYLGFNLPSDLWPNRVNTFDVKYATPGSSFVKYGLMLFFCSNCFLFYMSTGDSIPEWFIGDKFKDVTTKTSVDTASPVKLSSRDSPFYGVEIGKMFPQPGTYDVRFIVTGIDFCSACGKRTRRFGEKFLKELNLKIGFCCRSLFLLLYK